MIFPLIFVIGGEVLKSGSVSTSTYAYTVFSLRLIQIKLGSTHIVKFYSKVPELKMTSISKKRKMQGPNKRKTGNWISKVVSSLFLST